MRDTMGKTSMSVGAAGALAGLACVAWGPTASATTNVVTVRLTAPIVGIAAAPTGQGYCEVASDGGIFTFGQSHFYGSMGGQHLNKPVVGMAATATGAGYWEVTSDGGIFTFGNAVFAGSMGGKTTGGAVVGVAADHAAEGYWEVATKGEAYSLGAAQFEGDIVEPATAPTPALLAEGSAIASVADGQLGQTNPYLYGPDGSTWCALFTSWVWRQAGVPIPETGPPADIGTWALTAGGTILPPTASPAPGDAVLWVGGEHTGRVAERGRPQLPEHRACEHRHPGARQRRHRDRRRKRARVGAAGWPVLAVGREQLLRAVHLRFRPAAARLIRPLGIFRCTRPRARVGARSRPFLVWRRRAAHERGRARTGGGASDRGRPLSHLVGCSGTPRERRGPHLERAARL